MSERASFRDSSGDYDPIGGLSAVPPAAPKDEKDAWFASMSKQNYQPALSANTMSLEERARLDAERRAMEQFAKDPFTKSETQLAEDILTGRVEVTTGSNIGVPFRVGATPKEAPLTFDSAPATISRDALEAMLAEGDARHAPPLQEATLIDKARVTERIRSLDESIARLSAQHTISKARGDEPKLTDRIQVNIDKLKAEKDALMQETEKHS